jgi:hypothetical protein
VKVLIDDLPSGKPGIIRRIIVHSHFVVLEKVA